MFHPCSSFLALASLLAIGLSGATAAEVTGTLSPVTTIGSDSVGSLAEDAAVGPYNQPDWTTARRFPTTRVYLQQDPGDAGFEQWWRTRSYNNQPAAQRFQEELEIGLPHRFMLDLYYTWAHEAGQTRFDEASVEVRYALADWGKIPFNPTLYVEYAFANHDFKGDTLETKFLLGDDVGKRIHWGLNFSFESELSHELSKEFIIAGGVGVTVIDQVLNAGLEMQYTHGTIAGQRSNPDVEFEIGPSLQWRISKKSHLDLVGLFGCTDQGPRFEGYLVFGWDFGAIGGGGGSKEQHGYTPMAVHQ